MMLELLLIVLTLFELCALESCKWIVEGVLMSDVFSFLEIGNETAMSMMVTGNNSGNIQNRRIHT